MSPQRPAIQFNHAKADYQSAEYREREARRVAELAELRRHTTVDRDRMKMRAKR